MRELSKLTQACANAWAEENYDEVEEIAEKIEDLKVLPRTQPGFKGKPKDVMENYLKETRVTDRELHAAEDEQKMAAWAEENENAVPPPEVDEKERQRMQLIESERNPFHPDIWQKIQDAPMDPEFDFLRNKHLFIPKGYRVKGCYEEEDDETQIFMVGPRFDFVVAEGVNYAGLELGFPFPAPPREILESYPYMPILPIKVENPDVGKEWYWRVKLIKK